MDYNIYIKLTNKCNLCCKHCYNEIMKNHNSMTDETLKNVVTYIKNFRKSHPNDRIDISLHGGEPMIYDLDKIEFLIESLSEEDLKWCVTTNLMYEITDKHLSIFNKMKPFDNNVLIMTSYDFGDTRFGNESKRELWKKNVRYLKSLNIEVQSIICLTKYVIENVTPEMVFDFINEMNLRYFNFERITETGRATQFNVKPHNKDVDEWLFKAYKIYEGKEYICPLFESIEQSINGIYLGCRARRCMERVITINPDGSIGACPNMADKTFNKINEEQDNTIKDYYICLEKNVDERCYMCNYYKYCNGDCFQLKWEDDYCPAPKKIYEYIINRH